MLERISENESFISDCKHLRSLLNSSTFEGTPDERSALLKSLQDLESEFYNLSEEIPFDVKMSEWQRRYAPLKFLVYKGYGYIAPKVPNGL